MFAPVVPGGCPCGARVGPRAPSPRAGRLLVVGGCWLSTQRMQDGQVGASYTPIYTVGTSSALTGAFTSVSGWTFCSCKADLLAYALPVGSCNVCATQCTVTSNTPN